VTELLITRGLPGSGKSTFACEWVAEDPGHRAEVNRDHLRLMMHGGFANAETQVTAARDAAIRALLERGVSVISSDTNLPQRTARDLARIGRLAGAEVKVIDLTNVDIDTCHARNSQRTEGRVPDHVIEDMYARYIKGMAYPLPFPEDDESKGKPNPVEYVPGLPFAVVVDIDGTVALKGDRNPFDESRVHEDRPNRPVIDAVHAAYLAGDSVIFLSGRTDKARAATIDWLNEHVGVPFVDLYMRKAGDSRKDSIVKRELFDTHVRGRFNISYVFDDLIAVVKMWREELGLTCLQVAPGNF
jgi:predicted kinase